MVKKNSNRWAVLIGINGCHESLGPLKYSVNDCRLQSHEDEMENG